MGFANAVNKTHVDEQYTKLMDVISKFQPERVKALMELYKDYEDRVKEAPASGRLNFHNAYEGGYLDHILNVLECARLMKRLYEHQGGTIDFTDEELDFVAIHHDLGKLGVGDEPYYVVQDSDWHRKNKLEVFKHNEDRQYMRVNDATIFILQQYGVVLTQNEFLSLKLTDGLYDESNKSYLQQYGAGPFPMRNNLYKIMHWADHMAASIENDEVRKRLTR